MSIHWFLVVRFTSKVISEHLLINRQLPAGGASPRTAPVASPQSSGKEVLPGAQVNKCSGRSMEV